MNNPQSKGMWRFTDIGVIQYHRIYQLALLPQGYLINYQGRILYTSKDVYYIYTIYVQGRILYTSLILLIVT